jgi:chromosome segregation protein
VRLAAQADEASAAAQTREETLHSSAVAASARVDRLEAAVAEARQAAAAERDAKVAAAEGDGDGGSGVGASSAASSLAGPRLVRLEDERLLSVATRDELARERTIQVEELANQLRSARAEATNTAALLEACRRSMQAQANQVLQLSTQLQAAEAASDAARSSTAALEVQLTPATPDLQPEQQQQQQQQEQRQQQQQVSPGANMLYKVAYDMDDPLAIGRTFGNEDFVHGGLPAAVRSKGGAQVRSVAASCVLHSPRLRSGDTTWVTPFR